MKVACPALQNGKHIPTKYCHGGVPGGQNVSLPVQWEGPPPGAESLVLTIVDRHPVARNWVHWYVIDIPPVVRGLSEGASGVRGGMPEGARELVNSYGEQGYGGPQPPRGTGPHEYVITVAALSVARLPVGPDPTPERCAKEMAGKVIASASVVGLYER